MAEQNGLSDEQQRLLEQLLEEEGVEVHEAGASSTEVQDESRTFDPRGGVWGSARVASFGPRQALYGVHHLPRAGRARETGVVLCYPIAQEYLRSHRAFVQLSNLLTREGFHVLRFDYFGTGDSSGATTEGSVPRWRSDVAEAIREIGQKAGVKHVSLVGLRLGAALAAAACSRATLPVRDLVLWDPVADGRAYLEELVGLHGALLQDPWRFSMPRSPDRGSHADELVGFPFPERLRREIEPIRLPPAVALDARRILLVVSEEREAYLQLRDRLQAAGTPVLYLPCASDGHWSDPDRIEEALLPSAILQAVVKRLAEPDA